MNQISKSSNNLLSSAYPKVTPEFEKSILKATKEKKASLDHFQVFQIWQNLWTISSLPMTDLQTLERMEPLTRRQHSPTTAACVKVDCMAFKILYRSLCFGLCNHGHTRYQKVKKLRSNCSNVVSIDDEYSYKCRSNIQIQDQATAIRASPCSALQNFHSPGVGAWIKCLLKYQCVCHLH